MRLLLLLWTLGFGLWTAGAANITNFYVGQVLKVGDVISVNPSGGGGGGSGPPSGALAWWKLDGDATDSTGNGNTLTLSGSPSFAAGQFGNALQTVSASSQRASIGASAVVTGISEKTNVSVSCWLKRSTSGSIAAISVGTSTTIAINLYSDGNCYFSCSGIAGTFYGSVALSGTAWHHLVLVFDGTLTGSARLAGYVDNSAASLTYVGTHPDLTWHFASSGESFFLGYLDVGNYTDCLIDDVVVYGRSLNSTEVNQLFTAP